MNVNYKKLWELLIDKYMKKNDLALVEGIFSNVLTKMNKGEFVSYGKHSKSLQDSGMRCGGYLCYE